MAQPAYIDLQTGPDRRYRLAVWFLWLTAAAAAVTHVHILAWPLSAAAGGLLVLLWPGSDHLIQRSRSLRLYRNGAARLGEQAGSWGRYSRCCRWYVLLLIDLPQRSERVLLSARHNSADNYRRLLVWTRFTPFNADPDRHPWQWL